LKRLGGKGSRTLSADRFERGQLDVLQGDGLHLEPSGSFLKCGLTTYGAFRYIGSSTVVVTSNS
jgi:hypothetical protein